MVANLFAWAGLSVLGPFVGWIQLVLLIWCPGGHNGHYLAMQRQGWEEGGRLDPM